MHALQLHAALGDHVARDRRIDAAGQQQHGSASHARGQAARSGLRRAVHIGRAVAHLDIDRVIRVMHIDRHVRKGLSQTAADLLRQADGRQRKALV